LKLADFGLARSMETPILDQIQSNKSTTMAGGSSGPAVGGGPEFTNKVITMWYRPPEILLGATHYGPAVDVWSAGCILAELFLKKPLFAGKSELDQLRLVVDMLGAPHIDAWQHLLQLQQMANTSSSSSSSSKPGSSKKEKSSPIISAEQAMQTFGFTPNAAAAAAGGGSAAGGSSPAAFAVDNDGITPSPGGGGGGGASANKPPRARLRERYAHKIPADALLLLEKMLDWDPRKRSSAESALRHRYFWTARSNRARVDRSGRRRRWSLS
jgi:serine/threonine protein kinase